MTNRSLQHYKPFAKMIERTVSLVDESKEKIGKGKPLRHPKSKSVIEENVRYSPAICSSKQYDYSKHLPKAIRHTRNIEAIKSVGA